MEYQFPKIVTDNTINQQIWKMREEMLEVEAEHAELILAQIKGEPVDYTNLTIEIFDLWQSLETYLQKLPLSKYEIDMLHRSVIRKNRARGYYEEG